MEDLRQTLEAALGEIYELEPEAPGVWYCAFQAQEWAHASECYLVEQDSGTISEEAKRYGAELPDCRGLLCYDLGKPDSGYQIIRYELARYRHWQTPSAETLQALREAAVFGMQDQPEYFGEYPAPLETPRGRALRSIVAASGVFCLETDQGEHMVAFSYPVWKTELPQEIRALGEQLPRDQAEGIDNRFGYLFFSEETQDIALREWEGIDPARAAAVSMALDGF